MRRWIGWALLLALWAACFPAAAETSAPADRSWFVPPDTAVVTMDGPQTTWRSLMAVACPAEGAVRLRITGPDGSVVYDAADRAVNGFFVSESVYLPLRGGNTRYTVSLTDDTGTRTAEVTRTQPYLEGVHASAGTLPLSAVTGRPGRERILFLRNEDGERRFPLVAGGVYRLGEAVCAVSEGWLTVSLEILPEARALLREAQVRTAFTADAVAGLIQPDEDAVPAGPDEPIDLQGHAIAAVWIGRTVSFDPAALESVSQSAAPEQILLWQEMENGEEPVG